MSLTLGEIFEFVASAGAARGDFYSSVIEEACRYVSEQEGLEEFDQNTVMDKIGPAKVKQLNHSNVETLAQFLFLMKLFRLNSDADRLRSYLEGHNSKLKTRIDGMRNGNRRYTASGKPLSSLQKGLLEDYQIDLMVNEADDLGLRYDQTSLGCLLIEVMSPATTRNLVILLSEYGFLRRFGNNTKVIRSLGILERLYGERVAKLLGENVIDLMEGNNS